MGAVLTGGPAFDKAVTDFKANFAANSLLVILGQFQFQARIQSALMDLVEDEFNAAPAVDFELLLAYRDWQRNIAKPEFAARVLKILKEKKLESTFPKTFKAFSPDPKATAVAAASTYDAYWHTGGIPASPTVTAPTAQMLALAYAKEKSACFDATTWMAKKWLQAKGSAAKPTAKTIRGLIGRPALKSAGGQKQVIVYDKSVLSDDIDRIASAVSAGVAMMVGVLSGDNHTNVGKKFPDPEHYLLLLAHDDAGRFLFWDSDSGTTNIASLPWGRGFGVLHYNRHHYTGLFSTAVDTGDLNNVVRNYHGDETVRHCYQAYKAIPIA